MSLTKPPIASTEWKKPVIPKKRKRGGVVKKADEETPEIGLDDIQITIEKAPKPIFSKANSSNKYVSSSPEPLPLFDCLYCAGIHEHLVLQTNKEK